MGLLDRISRRRSSRASRPSLARGRRARFEPLEDRRLLSVSSFEELLASGDPNALREVLTDEWAERSVAEAVARARAEREAAGEISGPPSAEPQTPINIWDILPDIEHRPREEPQTDTTEIGEEAAQHEAHPWAAVMDPELIVLYHEYQQFLADGGVPAHSAPSGPFSSFEDLIGQFDDWLATWSSAADFEPSSPFVNVEDDQVMIEVTAVEWLVQWEHQDEGDKVRVENTAFLERFVEKLEGLGMEVTRVGRTAVSGRLPVDALDELLTVPEIEHVDAATTPWQYADYIADHYRGGRPLAEVLDADLLDMYHQFRASMDRGDTPWAFTRRVSVDIITEEPIVTEHIIDGYVVRTTNEAFLSQLADAAIHFFTIREFGVTASVLVEELDTLAGLAGVESVVPAGHAGQGSNDVAPPPEEPAGDRPPLELPVATPIRGPGVPIKLPVDLPVDVPVDVLPPIGLPVIGLPVDPDVIVDPGFRPVITPERPIDGPSIDFPAPRGPDTDDWKTDWSDAAAALYHMNLELAANASTHAKDAAGHGMFDGLDAEMRWLVQNGWL